MTTSRSFGRRAAPQPQMRLVPAPVREAAAAPAIPVVARAEEAPHATPPAERANAGLDRELEEWKAARRKNFKLPWRQLSLMASLCFGIASFVLPDSVNDNVQWLLLGLMAASFYAGVAKRREKKAKAAEAPP